MVELRCPVHHKLFAKVESDADPALTSFEVPCRSCRTDAGPGTRMVLHVFDASGNCVATLVQQDAPR